MRFSVLGLVSLSDGVDTVVLPPAKPTSLLAALLLRPNQTVAAEYLQSVVWEDSPPPTAKATLQTYILRLRRLFRDFGVAGSVIETVPGGYRFPATAATLDLVEFREVLGQAQFAVEARAELALLRHALALWQGPPLANIRLGPLQRDYLPYLIEEWLRAAERRFDLELDLGQHREVTAELRSAVREHPGYERFREQLIEALYRSGRQADALSEYGNVKRHLRDELGIDPGAGLRRLELAVLRGEELPQRGRAVESQTRLIGNRSPVAEPGELPPVRRFVGRAAEVGMLCSWLAADRPAPLVVISGPPGIGKTALAVHVAHVVQPAFPGWRQLVRMTDADGAPRPADEIASELAYLHPTNDSSTRTLLVFDDVVDTAQLRPLLGGGPDCAAIVTSRSSLAGLAARRGGVVLRLGPLDPADSDELLTQALGERAPVDAVAKRRIADTCDHFPAALLVASGRLAGTGSASVAASVAAMSADPMGWLAAAPDRATSIFHHLGAYLSTLDVDLVEAFRAAARVPAGELPVTLAEGVLEELVDASLLELGPGGGYRMYSLLRSFAVAWAAQCASALAGPAG